MLLDIHLIRNSQKDEERALCYTGRQRANFELLSEPTFFTEFTEIPLLTRHACLITDRKFDLAFRRFGNRGNVSPAV